MTESAQLLMLVGAASPPGRLAVVMAFAAEAARVSGDAHH